MKSKNPFVNKIRDARSNVKVAEKAYANRISLAMQGVSDKESEYQSLIDSLESSMINQKNSLIGEKQSHGQLVVYGDRVAACGETLNYSDGPLEARVDTSGNKYSTTEVTGKSGGLSIGRGAVGTIIAGPVGGIVGAMTKKGTTTSVTTVHDERQLFITITGSEGTIVASGLPDREQEARALCAAMMRDSATYPKRLSETEREIAVFEKQIVEAKAATEGIEDAKALLEIYRGDRRGIEVAEERLHQMIAEATNEDLEELAKSDRRAKFWKTTGVAIPVLLFLLFVTIYFGFAAK